MAGGQADAFAGGDFRFGAAGVDAQVAVEQGAVVVFAGDAERLGQLAGAVAQIFQLFGFASFLHELNAGDGFKGADEDGFAFAGFAADDVQTMVHPVNKINIGAAGGSEHRRVAGGRAAAGMAAGIVMVQIGFRLDNYSPQITIDEAFTQQRFGEFDSGLVEKFLSERHCAMLGPYPRPLVSAGSFPVERRGLDLRRR